MDATSSDTSATLRTRQRASVDPDPSFSTTLARGLALLTAFDPSGAALSNSELARRTGLSRPTVSRLAGTLLRLGYLRRDENERYALSVRVLRMAYPMLSQLRLRQVAQPLIREFAEQVRGTVSLGMLDGTEVVYVETSRTAEAAAWVPDIGVALPLVRTAIGRALLAMLEPPDRNQLLAEIRVGSPDLWQRYGKNTLAGVRECEDRGFCVSLGDYRAEVHAVGVPLAVSPAGERFAVNCGVPLYRLQPGQLEDEIGPRLVALAASIRELAGNLLLYR